jgi:hypothetical protein
METTGRASGHVRLFIVAMLLAFAGLPAVAQAETPDDFVDWTAVSGNVATGSVHGTSVSLSGSEVTAPPASTVDGSSAAFAGAAYTPSLSMGDAIRFVAGPNTSYTLNFGQPVLDPVLHLRSLASTLEFPAETPVLKVSGDPELTADIGGVAGQPGGDEGNGTVRVRGRYTSLTFTTQSSAADEVLLQVGFVAPLTVADFTDWTDITNNVASGTVHGTTVSLAGSIISPTPTSRVDGSTTVFSGPDFTPSLPTSDAIHIIAGNGYAFTLNFGAPVTDPVLHVDSLGSILHFPAGTVMSEVSGSQELQVDDGAILGAVNPDASGTVQFYGTFTSLYFTTSYAGLDGVNLQVGDSVPPDRVPPATTVWVDSVSGTPQRADGSFDGAVLVHATGIDPQPASGPVETRCAFDPPAAPTGFDNLLSKCDSLVATSGTHTVYAASRDAAGNVEAPVRVRSFRIARTPDTTITSGPNGPIWNMISQFTFTASVEGSTFECSLDGGTWAGCTTPYTTPPLNSGEHRFAVRATSPEGVVDATPAIQDFEIKQPEVQTASCQVIPVYDWVWDPRWFAGERDSSTDRWACIVGRPMSSCPRYHECRWSNGYYCPTGATCTVTTRAEWSDQDAHINHGAEAVAMFGATRGFEDSIWGPFMDGAYKEAICGVHGGHSCTATDTTVHIGDGHGFGGCAWHGGPLPFAPVASSPDAISLGPDSQRTLRCFVSMQVEPAQVLEAVQSVGPFVTIFIPDPGQLKIRPLPLPASLGAKRTRPAIAPINTTVGQPGPSRLRLRLNAPAKRLLARRHSLPVALDMTFTPASGAATKRTTHLTLRSAAKPPKQCAIHKPTRNLRRLQKVCHIWRHA